MDNEAISFQDQSRKYETIVYAAMWLLVFMLPFLNEIQRMINQQPFSWYNVVQWLVGMFPYLLVFCLNNYILAPRYLMRKKEWIYILSLLLMMVGFVLFHHFTFDIRCKLIASLFDRSGSLAASVYRPVKARFTFLGIPMPVILNLSLFYLLIGANLTTIFVFKYAREREKREVLENRRLSDELRFLKAQIHPHFFMNMLNNIHAMIELDPVKAQDMTIELSRLMRYAIYEGDKSSSNLAAEVSFVSSYVKMLRCRYPMSKVEINLDVPEKPSREFLVPSMIFISFVENAFKHGISYKKKSSIDISFKELGDKVQFTCVNTINNKTSSAEDKGGLGLDNVSRRLKLLYGDNYTLDIKEDAALFNVKLIIPGL